MLVLSLSVTCSVWFCLYSLDITSRPKPQYRLLGWFRTGCPRRTAAVARPLGPCSMASTRHADGAGRS